MNPAVEVIARALPPTLGSVKERERVAERVLAALAHEGLIVTSGPLVSLPEITRVYRSAA